MVTVTSQGPRPYTYADLEAMPDDGRRYEIIDGILVVSPAPRWTHQDAVAELVGQLRAACPAELIALPAPVDVLLAEDTLIQPDIVVARRADFDDRRLLAAPTLAVEVLSPRTRSFDLMVKRERLQRAECPHYWLVDPDEPSLLALELKDGIYQQVGFVTGDETYTATLPYEVSVVPANLVSA